MDVETRKILEELREGQTELREGQERIMFVLKGDETDVNAQSGLVAIVRNHDVSLYGREKPKEVGVVAKVEELWNGRTKIIAACAVVTVIGGFLAWLIPLLPLFRGH